MCRSGAQTESTQFFASNLQKATSLWVMPPEVCKNPPISHNMDTQPCNQFRHLITNQITVTETDKNDAGLDREGGHDRMAKSTRCVSGCDREADL
jgi:hypothetical protein